MAWFWLAVVVASAPLAVVSLRGRWLLAGLPFAAFVWGFGQVVLAEEPALAFHLVWLVALVGLEAALAAPPTADSWWISRYRSWRGWRNNPGGVLAVLVGSWIVFSGIPVVGLFATVAVLGATILTLTVAVRSTISAFVTRDRSAESRAVAATSGALPIAAVVAALIDGAFVFGF